MDILAAAHHPGAEKNALTLYHTLFPGGTLYEIRNRFISI